MWSIKEANQFDTGPTMCPCPGLWQTHDLGLKFSRLNFESAWSQEWEGWHGTKTMWSNWSFLTMTKTFAWPWWGGWVDVRYNDWGDFRRRRAADTSSYRHGSPLLCFVVVSHKFIFPYPGISLGMHPANERRRYIVTTSLIGWAHTQNDPWPILIMFCWLKMINITVASHERYGVYNDP